MKEIDKYFHEENNRKPLNYNDGAANNNDTQTHSREKLLTSYEKIQLRQCQSKKKIILLKKSKIKLKPNNYAPN